VHLIFPWGEISCYVPFEPVKGCVPCRQILLNIFYRGIQLQNPEQGSSLTDINIIYGKKLKY
jgi:hypothetical protein